MPAIELAAPRIIAIEDRGKKYSLTLTRITRSQWIRYFEGIISTSENQGGKRVDSFDSTSARVELVEKMLMAADGYRTAGDLATITSLPGWQQLIPLRHRQAAGNALVDVERAEPTDDDAIMLGAEPVSLNALWSSNDRGEMVKYSGLLHCFRTPSSEHQRRFSRDSSRSVVVGGRRGTTKWLGVQVTLMELYDELIESVDGYTVNGEPLADRAEIVKEMDGYHKVAAADVLFSPMQANVVDEGK